MSSPLCIGHRGAKGYVAENTLPSFEYAIELGCDWIELDVYCVEDDLLVIHDDELDRTTNGSGLVMEQTLDYLRSLDAGDGARIPTLPEVINLVDRRCGINVDLKGKGTAQPVSELLQRYCRQGWDPEAFLLSSFNHKELALGDEVFRRGALYGKLLDDLWQRAEDLAAWSVNFDMKDVTEPLVSEAHERGYQVLVYTVNVDRDIMRMLDCGVDGLFSDFPDRVLKLRSSHS